MSEDLFPRANALGMGLVRAWLPDGIKRGDEWVATNPTRTDSKKGSFSFNLETGAWCDFACPDDHLARGGDAVSLFAYLNKSVLQSRTTKYKNPDRALQVEAAKEILIAHDPDYFPSSKDTFKIPKRKKTEGGYWSNFEYVPEGIAEPPELDVTWYAKNWGEAKAFWSFKVNNKIVLWVCRFFQDGKKQDRPFTLWSDGRKYRWRAKAPQGKYPLFGIDEVEAQPNKKILLYEGQKAASAVRDFIGEWFVCLGWYGGVNAIDKQDWKQLQGNEIWYCFDADIPGRRSIEKIKHVCSEYDIKLNIVYPPQNVKKGWDHADAIEDGWSPEELKYLIENEANEDKVDSGFVDDERTFNFEILGYTTGGKIAFYPHGKKTITYLTMKSLSKNTLMELQDKNQYAEYFQREAGGVAWDCAINTIARIAEAKPIFDSSKIRGTGAWKDGGKIVINTGKELIVEGKTRELYESPGDYIYQRDKELPYQTTDPLDLAEAKKLTDVCKKISWKKETYAQILAGWLTLAPFGGLLKWRPYVWLTGPLGTGKTWTLENIANKIVGNNFGIFARGTSSPAGIRNALGNNSIATIMDEMESDNPALAEKIEQNLRMFREGSSNTGAATLHGTVDGEGRAWYVQSMALFASIGAAMKHGADRSRFTEIVLGANSKTNIDKHQEKFRELEKAIEIFTPSWVRSYHARTLKLWNEIEKSIMILSEQCADVLGTKRQGDQIGALLGGCWMSQNDNAISAAQAAQWIEELGIKTIFGETEEKTDEELCLDEILSSRIELQGEHQSVRCTVGAALSYWYAAKHSTMSYEVIELKGIEYKKVKKELEQYGIKPAYTDAGYVIRIAMSHPAIRKMLKETPWSTFYGKILARLDFCSETKGPTRFAGIAKRYRELDAAEALDGPPF
jgi:hypothetical protein